MLVGREEGAGCPGPSRLPSRPQVYVQHLLKRDGAHLWKLIHEGGAHIYVCG